MDPGQAPEKKEASLNVFTLQDAPLVFLESVPAAVDSKNLASDKAGIITR